MSPIESIALHRLKQAIEAQFRGHYPACEAPIQEWKGKVIGQFQQDLSDQVGGYVSEKWFYTHLKTVENTKLPRVDMLNMLVQYVGGKDWQTYKASCSRAEEKVAQKPLQPFSSIYWNKQIIIAATGGLAVFLVLLLVAFRQNTSYQFCVVDQDDRQPIAIENLQVFLLQEGQSPLKLPVDSLGCITLEKNKATLVELKIQALYYQPQIIKRKLQAGKQSETIALKKDDYALMLHYFSTQKTKDWQSRRKQLDVMLSDKIKVIQISEQTGGGIALYNKQEFINKMTLPIGSLQDIEILHTNYEGDKIVEIRFLSK